MFISLKRHNNSTTIKPLAKEELEEAIIEEEVILEGKVQIPSIKTSPPTTNPLTFKLKQRLTTLGRNNQASKIKIRKLAKFLVKRTLQPFNAIIDITMPLKSKIQKEQQETNLTSNEGDPHFYVDSSAPAGMTNKEGNLKSLKPYFGIDVVFVLNEQSLSITHMGKTFLKTSESKLCLNNIFVVPNLKMSLLSLYTL